MGHVSKTPSSKSQRKWMILCKQYTKGLTELTEEMTGLLQVQARQNPSMKTGG